MVPLQLYYSSAQNPILIIQAPILNFVGPLTLCSHEEPDEAGEALSDLAPSLVAYTSNCSGCGVVFRVRRLGLSRSPFLSLFLFAPSSGLT